MTQMYADKDPQTHAIIGAAMEVHSRLGHGFLEAVYQEALAREFEANEIDYSREVQFPIIYRERPLATHYKADFLCFGSVIVELKALPKISSHDEAQCINYLKASGHDRCMLLNFGASRLEFRRLILSHPYLRPSASSADQSLESIRR